MLWHLSVSLLKHSFVIRASEAVVQPGAVTSPWWVQDMLMCHPQEGTCPWELVAHVQGELSLELWASLGQTPGVTRAQRDPWNTWLPRVRGVG